MTWVKICGTTNLEDARLAVAAGADALGFVFAESPRQVTPEEAREIIAELPEPLEKIGVFVHLTVERIKAIVETAGLTGVQLHEEKAQRVATLRKHFDSSRRKVRLLSVWKLDELPPMGSFGLEVPAGNDRPDALLLDSRAQTSHGGTGTSFDWGSWGRFFENRRIRQGLPPLIVAGGLNPENVTEAVGLLHPWGVDVVSGVEREPGKKDPEKVRAFINAVRQTDKEYSRL